MGVLSKPDDENLIIREMPTISEKDFEEFRNKIIQDPCILKNLYDYLMNMNFNFKNSSCGQSLGGLSPLIYLIETFFISKERQDEMNNKYNQLKPYIYNYRTIYGDGNCYYRAAIFRYLEILILSNEIEILRNFVYDLVQSFNNSEELKKRKIIQNSDIKPDLTFKILFLIVDLLKNYMISEAHQILIKSFSTCKKFDYTVILYFRYILYDYIKKNENKIYLKSFPIKIGNLLPYQFETDSGEFLFNSFYENYLLKFFKDAEKIIIYLTPFVLGIELNIIVFDLEQDEIFQKFIYDGKPKIKTDDVITLLNKRNHYEIVYTKKDNDKYKNIFQIYENNLTQNIFVPKDEDDDDDVFSLLKSMNPKTEVIPKRKNINDMYANNQDKGEINTVNKDNNIKYEAGYTNNKNTNNLNIDNNKQNNKKYPKNNIDNNSNKNNNINPGNMKSHNNNSSHSNNNNNNNNNINNNLNKDVNNKFSHKDYINQKNNNINNNENINQKANKKDHSKVNNQNDTRKEILNNNHHREENTNLFNPNTAIIPKSKKEKETKEEIDLKHQKVITKKKTDNKNFDTGEKKANNNNNNKPKMSNETSNTENKEMIFHHCFMCSKKFESREKYCESCIRQRMFDVFFDYYQKYPQIDENNFFLDQYINRNNQNYKKKINKEEILKNAKNGKLCLFEKEHKIIKKELPCGCHICNYLIEFFKKYNFQTSFRCKCSHKYKRYEMILLKLLFDEEKNTDISNNIIQYFNIRFDNCCICNIKLTKKNNSIKYNMGIPNEKNVNIIKFINKNRHYVCDQCIKKLGNEFFCQICHINHLINK